MKKTICCVAGKSGGHIIPCLTYIQYHSTIRDNHILFFSTKSQIDSMIMKSFPVTVKHVPLAFDGIPTKKTIFGYLRLLVQLTITTLKTLFYLLYDRPKKIISTGGYVAVPVCLIGYLLKIPIELFELNAVPGRAIIFLARFASVIHTCFPEAKNALKDYKTDSINYPVRFSHQAIPTRKAALENLNFSDTKKTILILGGSQGSLFLNNLIQTACTSSDDFFKNIQIIHQTGECELSIKEFYSLRGINSCVFSYTPSIEQFYPAADLVICRAGAGTLFETLFFKKKAIIIPLEARTTDHQVDNALSFQTHHPELFTVLRQNELLDNPNVFTQQMLLMMGST